MLLEANKIGKGVPEEALKKINKVKHMIIDTEYEYLLTKVFVQEAKVYEMLGEKEQQVKCLKKCIEYEKNYAIQFAR